MSLLDRASELPAGPTGGVPCGLGTDVIALGDPLRDEAVELILSTVESSKVVSILSDDDVGIATTPEQIQRHRRGGCKWCKNNGGVA